MTRRAEFARPQRPVMTLVAVAGAVLGLAAIVGAVVGASPSVYPTGTTIYDPVRTWNGFTILGLPDTGAALVDMNGRTVREWPYLEGASPGPMRILPGGFVAGPVGRRPPHQEALGLAVFDWNDKEVWKFDHAEQVTLQDGTMVWSARQHHDWQRTDFPSGYYSPDTQPQPTGERTLILSHRNHVVPAVSSQALEDDRLIEVDQNGRITWDWLASAHVDEFGFTPEARKVIQGAPGFSRARGSVDWLHVNSATYVGPNRWYDAGDQRFHPDNVIVSSRDASVIAIVSRDGRIVWRLGPDYRESEATRAIGQIVGQHHPHLIPKGLPGAGNLLVFDNGGSSGYGFAGPSADDGVGGIQRDSSRVVEIDPVSLKKVWEYAVGGTEHFRFFSHYVSSAQRLPNGNTFITEGADGRLFEVTSTGELVWEYVSPYFRTGPPRSNRVYRAYRVPYEWVPQLPRPTERAVVPPDVSDFRLPAQ